MEWKRASRMALLGCMLLTVVSLSATTTLDRLEEKSGWQSCSACTKSTGIATTSSMTQSQTSPSLDGSSTKFHLGTTESLADMLWYKRAVNSSSATHFRYTVHYYYQHPGVPTGMEFSTSEHVGYKWYRWDWQCSYYYGVWRIWDNANSAWINVPVACTRPTAYKWTTVQFEGHRYNGKVYFDAITINGAKHYINRSVYPKTLSYSGNWVTVHFQLNGDKAGTDFNVWGDQFSLTYW